MTVEQHQVAANPQTKPTDLGWEPVASDILVLKIIMVLVFI